MLDAWLLRMTPASGLVLDRERPVRRFEVMSRAPIFVTVSRVSSWVETSPALAHDAPGVGLSGARTARVPIRVDVLWAIRCHGLARLVVGRDTVAYTCRCSVLTLLGCFRSAPARLRN